MDRQIGLVSDIHTRADQIIRFFSLSSQSQVTRRRMLAFLLHRRGTVVSAGELLDHVYESGTDREANAIEALVARLRRKLGVPLIETRRGHGYVVAAGS